MMSNTSIRANSIPGHIRGPAPNGMYVYGGYDDFDELSNRDGSNLFGSSNILSSMCVADATQKTCDHNVR